MIRLDGNSLAAFRGAGVAGTVQSVAGCELFGAARMPSWADPSPYSAAATEWLKAKYPDQWDYLRKYGFDHSVVVPLINENPMYAFSWLYNQSGLVFKIDCGYKCTTQKWIDEINGLEFIGSNVQLTDHVPMFDGTAHYGSNDSTGNSLASSTFELIFEADSSETGIVFCDGRSDYSSIMQFAFYAPNYIIPTTGSGSGGATYNHYMFPYVNNNFNTCSFIVDDKMIVNGTKYNRANSKDGWYFPNTPIYKTIGKNGRPNGTTFFKGKIYAIRIYNRLLTEQEILANQAIDLQRWQPA